MIELRGVHVELGGRTVLHGVDLSVEEGELLLVTGRTGVGKSTLLGTLNGLVPWFTGGRFVGQVLLDGADITARPPRERAGDVGYVGQDPAAGFVTDTVEEELAYGMEQLGLDPATMRRRVEETLDLLGVADLRERDLRTLSGGQQQRVAIGSVLTMHPRLLVLDEPTSALDPTAAEDVLATLSRLVHDLGLAVVVSEHRLERVVPFADRICLLPGDGRARVGEPGVVLDHSPVAPPIVGLGKVAGWHPLPLSVRDARRAERDAPVVPGGATDHTIHRSTGELSADPMLTARGLRVTYGRTTALRGVDLELHSGQVTALMGRNGAGKSSLLWALREPQRRAAGTVTGAGVETGIGLVPQTAADLLYLETVAEECETADLDAHAEAGTTRALLDRLVPDVPDEIHPRDLSEGQRLALVLAVVLAAGPGVVALDEPTRGLDYPAKRALTEILTGLAARGHAVVVATHDVEFVAEVADRVVVLAEGEVVSDGPTVEVVAQSPAFAPQVTKILGTPWLTVDQVVAARGSAS